MRCKLGSLRRTIRWYKISGILLRDQKRPSNVGACAPSFGLRAVARALSNSILKTASRNRDLYCIGMGDNRYNEDELTLASYHYGVEKVVSLAKCQAHGAWIEWLIPADSNW